MADREKLNPTLNSYVLVLDYWNKPSLKAILIHAITVDNFTLLELLGKPEMKFSTLERICIGPEHNEKINSVRKSLDYKYLRSKAKQNLKPAINYIVLEKSTETDLVKQARSFFISCTSDYGIEVTPRRFNNFIILTILNLIKSESHVSLSLLKRAILRKYISGPIIRHNQQRGMRYQH
jgi:hypothetical protein